MKKSLLIFVLSLFISGCVTHREISGTSSISGNSWKIQRFNYMQKRWSYTNNNWIIGKKITPYLLSKDFNISNQNAKEEIDEFEHLQKSFSKIQRFFISLNLDSINYYADPPE